MKIAEISANWGRGGPGGVMKDLYSVFTAQGDECLVCYGRGTVPADVNGYRIGSAADNIFHGVRARLFDAAGFGSKRATEALVRKLDAYEPDAIHLHNLLGYYLNVDVLFRYLKTAGIPVVWTLHDCWAFTGHCINFEQAGCERWAEGCFDCPLKNAYPESLCADRSRQNFERKRELFTGVPGMTLVTPSRWLKDAAERSFLREYPIRVIPNGIDTNVFRYRESDLRARYGLEGKTILLAVAGVWNRMKGLYLVNELAELLHDEYRIVLIGDTGKQPVSEKILHLGRTENVTGLVEWYSAADMLINPTFGDNFPTVNLEALCCGTPVVTNATGGSPEAAGNAAGRVVTSKTAEEFAEKIAECRNEHYDRAFIRRNGERYDKAACAASYSELLRKEENPWHC
ncbi:MAG: glycosyltransferase [Clostridia bacterium]|nr:glycosyltransferase [Clostridia bacterium]